MKQGKAKVTIVDVGDKGTSHGDIIAFEASLTLDNGTKGEIRGTVTIVDMPTGSNDPHYDAVENILLDFGGQDTIVAIGKSTWSGSATAVATHAPVVAVRAIAGGTGRYIGARGQITSIGSDSGLFDHTVILLD